MLGYTHNAALQVHSETVPSYIQKYIIYRCLASKLPGKHRVKAVVVADAGKSKGFGWQWAFVECEPADKFGSKMVYICFGRCVHLVCIG
jgi:hypothetical protein